MRKSLLLNGASELAVTYFTTVAVPQKSAVFSQGNIFREKYIFLSLLKVSDPCQRFASTFVTDTTSSSRRYWSLFSTSARVLPTETQSKETFALEWLNGKLSLLYVT